MDNNFHQVKSRWMKSKQDTEHDDFVKNHPFSNIDDVFEPLEILFLLFKVISFMQFSKVTYINIYIYNNFQEKTVIIVGTVKGIRQNIPKQKESSTDKVDGSHEVAEIVTYACTNPKCKNMKISVIPRFKISLRVQDNTGTLTFTIFDQEAKKLFKYTAKELYDKNKELDIGMDLYPMELKVVVDKKNWQLNLISQITMSIIKVTFMGYQG
uniref:Replication factor A C-terminal domain-containing protein n=1 Tax=Lactuca sativa TaxID=4236 RepID=A0A9R1WEW5_LACSA|nr:hypothetical protein LSAT_V11C200095330 [Lactuca sativa]